MSIFGKLIELPQEANQPDRPSHWHEDQNERDILPQVEYPTQEAEDASVDYGPRVPPPVAAPVYLVEPPPVDRTLRDWQAGNAEITANKREQIAFKNRRRVKLTVRNHDTDTNVYLTKSAEDTLINAFILPFGEEVTFIHNESVWAITQTSPNTAFISWFAEFEPDDKL